jgi:type I restriction enzyme M protein
VAEHNPNLTREQKKHLKEKALRGWELVQARRGWRDEHDAARHRQRQIGAHRGGRRAGADPGERFDVVLANPPFGKKSSTMITGPKAKSAPRRT